MEELSNHPRKLKVNRDAACTSSEHQGDLILKSETKMNWVEVEKTFLEN